MFNDVSNRMRHMFRKIALFFFCFLLGDCSTSVLDPSAGIQIERLAFEPTGMVLEVHKIQAHQFLAEYDFKLVLKSGSKEIDSKNLTGDTGGYSRIDVLRISRGLYAFRDHGRTFCLNMDEPKLNSHCDPVAGTRLGHFDFDSSRRWRYIREVEGGF